MKTREQVKPNYAPIYAGALYPDLAKVFVCHGYALAVHGSLARDIDLIAVPWCTDPSPIDEVIKSVNATFAVQIVGEPEQKNHGRIAYTLALGFGECSIDLSFLPQLSTLNKYRATIIETAKDYMNLVDFENFKKELDEPEIFPKNDITNKTT